MKNTENPEGAKHRRSLRFGHDLVLGSGRDLLR